MCFLFLAVAPPKSIDSDVKSELFRAKLFGILIVVFFCLARACLFLPAVLSAGTLFARSHQSVSVLLLLCQIAGDVFFPVRQSLVICRACVCVIFHNQLYSFEIDPSHSTNLSGSCAYVCVDLAVARLHRTRVSVAVTPSLSLARPPFAVECVYLCFQFGV